MGGSARDAAQSLTTEMGKFSTKVQGAPGAISAATSAMQLFGAAGTPAVQTVGSALASILASGFTPLGLGQLQSPHQHFGGLAKGACGIDNIVNDNAHAVFHVTDDRHFGHFARFFTAFIYDRQR